MLNISAISNVNQSAQLNKQNNTAVKVKYNELNYGTTSFKSKSLTATGTNTNIFKKFLAAIGLCSVSSAMAALSCKNSDLSYRDYVNIDQYDFPEGSTITLPSGESADLTEYANNNSFEYWKEYNKPQIQEFVLLNPDSTEKQLKKFIPTLERSFSGDRLCIPHKGYGSEWIDLSKKNILVNEGKYQTLYGKDRIERYVPIDAVANGESGKIDISKVPYGKKIACYTVSPCKRFFVPAGSQININGNIINVDNNSLAGKIYENSDLDFEDSLSNFIYRNKPTDSKQSKQMFETIRNVIDEKDLYVKSELGVKFEYLKEDGKIKFYKIGNVKFQVIGNIRGHGGGMDGYYYDIFEATPSELDKLYRAYLTHSKLAKNGGEITLNRDDGSIDAR